MGSETEVPPAITKLFYDAPSVIAYARDNLGIIRYRVSSIRHCTRRSDDVTATVAHLSISVLSSPVHVVTEKTSRPSIARSLFLDRGTRCGVPSESRSCGLSHAWERLVEHNRMINDVAHSLTGPRCPQAVRKAMMLL